MRSHTMPLSLHARRHMHGAVLAALVTASAGIAGCWSRQPARSVDIVQAPGMASREPIYPQRDAWPARDRDAVLPLLAATRVAPASAEDEALESNVDSSSVAEIVLPPGAVMPTDGTLPEGTRVIIRSMRFQTRGGDVRCVYAGLHGQGLLRLYVKDTSLVATGMSEATRERDLVDRFGFIPNGRVATSRSVQDPFDQLMLANSNGPYLALMQMFQDIGLETIAASDTLLAMPFVGVPIAIPPVTPDPCSGVLIHMQSLAPNPFEPRVLDEFRARGWLVVSIATQSQIFPPGDDQQLQSLRGRLAALGQAEASELRAIFKGYSRFNAHDDLKDRTERFQFHAARARRQLARDIDRARQKRAFEVPWDLSALQANALGASIAREVDNSLAGNAYALEAVLDYLQTQRPELAGKPRVIAGFSAGALVAPTGIARVRPMHPIAAVVLVGGGADMFYLSQESTLTDGGVRLRTGPVRTPAALRWQLHPAYLRHTCLDPLHTAAALRGLPILQLHAAWDQWVPHEAGTYLWELLDQPERWTLRGGHLALFVLLPSQAERIADWVERQIR